MNDIFPSTLEGSSLMQVGLVAVAGLAAFGVAFMALRVVAGRRTNDPAEAGGEQHIPDPFTFGSKFDRRSAHRRNGNPLAVCVAHKNDPHFDGRLHDRSIGGVCFTAPRDFVPGTLLRVRPNNGSPTAPWVDVEVKSCLPQGGEWQIGCSFLKTPPYAVILMFG